MATRVAGVASPDASGAGVDTEPGTSVQTMRRRHHGWIGPTSVSGRLIGGAHRPVQSPGTVSGGCWPRTRRPAVRRRPGRRRPPAPAGGRPTGIRESRRRRVHPDAVGVVGLAPGDPLGAVGRVQGGDGGSAAAARGHSAVVGHSGVPFRCGCDVSIWVRRRLTGPPGSLKTLVTLVPHPRVSSSVPPVSPPICSAGSGGLPSGGAVVRGSGRRRSRSSGPSWVRGAGGGKPSTTGGRRSCGGPASVAATTRPATTPSGRWAGVRASSQSRQGVSAGHRWQSARAALWRYATSAGSSPDSGGSNAAHRLRHRAPSSFGGRRPARRGVDRGASRQFACLPCGVGHGYRPSRWSAMRPSWCRMPSTACMVRYLMTVSLTYPASMRSSMSLVGHGRFSLDGVEQESGSVGVQSGQHVEVIDARPEPEVDGALCGARQVAEAAVDLGGQFGDLGPPDLGGLGAIRRCGRARQRAGAVAVMR